MLTIRSIKTCAVLMCLLYSATLSANPFKVLFSYMINGICIHEKIIDISANNMPEDETYIRYMEVNNPKSEPKLQVETTLVNKKLVDKFGTSKRYPFLRIVSEEKHHFARDERNTGFSYPENEKNSKLLLKYKIIPSDILISGLAITGLYFGYKYLFKKD